MSYGHCSDRVRERRREGGGELEREKEREGEGRERERGGRDRTFLVNVHGCIRYPKYALYSGSNFMQLLIPSHVYTTQNV